MYKHNFQRHKTREVRVGNLVIGGDNPIVVQSMTTPDTYNIDATVAEIHRLEEAGCELVRVTVFAPDDLTLVKGGPAGRRDSATSRTCPTSGARAARRSASVPSTRHWLWTCCRPG